jgi:tetratricopeptide (TPR) repeat protein
VFWIHASNVDRVRQGYREIAERAQIPGREDPKGNILDLVARWLRNETKGPWLLVLDNLDNDAVLSAPDAAASRAQSSDTDGSLQRPWSAYLPQSEHGAILITTRTRSVATKLVEPRDIIPVEPMTDQDAVTLLKKKLDQPADGVDLEELASTLEYMPLAIVQAAAYIQLKGARYSVRQYVNAFRRSEKQQTSLLNYEAGHLRRDPEAKNSIVITWQISFDEIREKWPASADLLSLMSYFDRQGIPEEVLQVQLGRDESEGLTKQTSGADVEESEVEEEDREDSDASETESDHVFEEAMARLQSYSFVSIGEQRGTLEMHSLVQLATRKWLEMHGQDERWKSQFSRKLNAGFPNGQYENWGRCEVLFPHAKSAERQRPAEVQSVREWAQILRKAAWYALTRGDYGEAQRMCEKSVKALSKASGKEDVETSYSLGLLASIYWNQGRWTEAEKLEVQVMETSSRVLGEEHPSTLTSMANLASTFWNQGRWTEAEKLEVQVMETSSRVLGEEHPSTLTSMANLASTYRNQGRWTEAEKLFMQVMETRKRVLGEEHPSTLTSMNNLAFTMKELGRNTEATKLMAECVQLQNRVLGTKHPDALSSAAGLAEWQSDGV